MPRPFPVNCLTNLLMCYIIIACKLRFRLLYLVRYFMYKANTANYPRMKTDAFLADYQNIYKYEGFVDKAIKYIERIKD